MYNCNDILSNSKNNSFIIDGDLMTEKQFEIYDEDDWELIAQYIRLVLEASHLPKWGHYELIDAHKDSNDEDIYKKNLKGVAKK